MLLVKRVAACLLLGVLAAATASTVVPKDQQLQEAEESDEFRIDPFLTQPKFAGGTDPAPAASLAAAAAAAAAAAPPTAGVWSNGEVSLAGLLSFHSWAQQEIRMGRTEYMALIVVVLYLAVYIRGRRRNQAIANKFIEGVHGLFCCRFLEAGPATEFPPADRRQLLVRDSCNSFLYYATGRRGCSGVLVTISLASRQDLFMTLWSLFSPVTDSVTIEVALNDDDVEPMVFALTGKRQVKRLLQDLPHLQDYTGVTRANSLPPGLVCLSETAALAEQLLQPPAVKILSDYSDILEFIHFTDQNDQPILGQVQTPRKALRFKFRLPVVSGDGTGDMNGGVKMIELALYYLELLQRFKLPSGMKKKAIERRDSVAKRKFKMTHAQRQERFQQLKNDRLQKEKEEYETLTPEQKRRRDLRDDKKAKKAASNRKLKMKMTKA